MKSTAEIQEFYDNDTRQKFKIRNNLRHYLIINRLLKAGLKSDSKVLEIGCGNGGVTKLIAERTKKGKVTAVDISQECIVAAKANLKSFSNIEYFVTDMSDFSSDHTFDIIVLPDVLEHIPLEQHDTLFKNLSRVLSLNGFIFIHIPEPKCLEWATKTMPEKLQIVDQPIHTDRLTSVTYKHGLYLKEMKSYRMFNEYEDYQYLIFTKREATYNYKTIPTWKVISKKWYYIFTNQL